MAGLTVLLVGGLAEGIPAVLVFLLPGDGGDSAPKEAFEVGWALVGQHAGGDEDLRGAVVIEIEATGGPGPTSHFDAFLSAGVFEGAIALVAEEGVAFGVALPEVGWFQVFGSNGSLAGIAPHVGEVEIGKAVAIVVEPGGAHAGTGIVGVGFWGYVTEDAVGIAVEVFATEVVGDAEVGPAIAVVVTPGGGKAEAVVVVVQACGGGGIDEGSGGGEFVAEEEVGGAIAGVFVGQGVAVLGAVAEEVIGAEIEIEVTVAVVIGGGHGGEAALGRGTEAEGVGVLLEFSAATIEEEEGAFGAEDDQVLLAGVAEIGEEGGGCGVEQAETGEVGDVFEGGTGWAGTAIAEEAIGETGGLADIDGVEAGVIDVADGNAVVTMDVNAGGGVEIGAPPGDSASELLVEGGGPGEGVGGDIGEKGLGAGGESFFEGVEGEELTVFPFLPPVADPVAGGGRDFEANAVFRKDEESGGGNGAKGLEPAFEVGREGRWSRVKFGDCYSGSQRAIVQGQG